MTNKYFSTVQTYEELKAAYKALVKTIHPDLGGNTQDFQEMQNEYESMIKAMPHETAAERAQREAEEAERAQREAEELREEEERKAREYPIYKARCAKWEKFMQEVPDITVSYHNPEYKAQNRKRHNIKRANILAMCKAAFPGVKFSLTKNNGWGSAWYLEWYNGPTYDEFIEATDMDLFVSAWDTFDGMTDCAGVERADFTDFAKKFMGGDFGSIDVKRVMDTFTREEMEEVMVVNCADAANRNYNGQEFSMTYKEFDKICAVLNLTEEQKEKAFNEVRKGIGYQWGLGQYDACRMSAGSMARCFWSVISYYKNETKSETKAATETPQAENMGEVLAEADGVQLVATEKGAQFVGNTYEHKAEIKALGARWYRVGSCWTIKAEQIAEAVELVKSWAQTEELPTDEPTESATESETECPAWAAAFVDMVGTFADAFNIATECPQVDEISTDEADGEQPTESATESEKEGEFDIIYFSPDDCPDLPELHDVEPTRPTEPSQPLSNEEAARVRKVFERYAARAKECEEENEHTGTVYNYGLALLCILHSSKAFEINDLLDQLEEIDRNHRKCGYLTTDEATQRYNISRTLCRYAVDYAGQELAALLFGAYMVSDVANEMRGAA